MFTYPPEDVRPELEEPERRREDPDVEYGDQGEDESPDDGGRDGDDRGEQTVEPQLDVGEDDEGELPDGVETLGRAGLGQNVVESEL